MQLLLWEIVEVNITQSYHTDTWKCTQIEWRTCDCIDILRTQDICVYCCDQTIDRDTNQRHACLLRACHLRSCFDWAHHSSMHRMMTEEIDQLYATRLSHDDAVLPFFLPSAQVLQGGGMWDTNWEPAGIPRHDFLFGHSLSLFSSLHRTILVPTYAVDRWTSITTHGLVILLVILIR